MQTTLLIKGENVLPFLKRHALLIRLLILLAVVFLPELCAADSSSPAGTEAPPIWTIIPFVAMLLTIAIAPLANPHGWEKPTNQTLAAALWSLPILAYFLMTDPAQLFHTFIEYVSFIVYVGGLFTVSGGVFIKADLKATPLVNTGFLAIGAVLANLVGTPGASMLLIRPLLNTNDERKHITHIPIFFIFIVSNIGGCLTPIGDPPLFLGFLRGVPFFWTLGLLPEWLLALAILLTVFYIWDTLAYRRETKTDVQYDAQHTMPLQIIGKRNGLFLLAIILAVLSTNSLIHFFESTNFGAHADLIAHLTRDAIILGLAIASYRLTPAEAHERNEFSFGPVREVAILFAGIFVTMIPALLILQARGNELGLTEPWQFFWATGFLSSFLDNAPTYLAFTAVAQGVVTATDGSTFGNLHEFIRHSPESAQTLRAISLGAVFMGANTYIGNGPNFMVKAIVQSRGIAMPSFFGYMGYAICILIPTFAIINLIFFGF